MYWSVLLIGTTSRMPLEYIGCSQIYIILIADMLQRIAFEIGTVTEEQSPCPRCTELTRPTLRTINYSHCRSPALSGSARQHETRLV